MRSMMPIFSTLLFAILAAACASTPPPAATATTKHSGPEIVPVSKLTGDQIVALQKQGYKLVNTNGETLYCDTDLKLGSHLQHENTCLTERQMVNLRDETQRRLRIVSMPRPPIQGN